MSAARCIAIMADVTALLCKAPRTVPEIRRVLDVEPDKTKSQAIQQMVNALHAEGLVYIRGLRVSHRGPAAIEYAWQPSIAPQVGMVVDVET